MSKPVVLPASSNASCGSQHANCRGGGTKRPHHWSKQASVSSFSYYVAVVCVVIVLALVVRQQPAFLADDTAATASTTQLKTMDDGSKRRAQHEDGGHTTPQPKSQFKQIRQITILGERNSGTRWTFDHVSECFNHSLLVTKRLTRYKHWFQYPNPSKYKHDTLVLAQFRNPYDWLKAMEHVPHHSPAHMRTKANASWTAGMAGNDWQVFLTKPWTMPRFGADLDLMGNETDCQEDFDYKDIVSCLVEPLPRSAYNHTIRFSEHQPFYEMNMDGSGKPYENILEMRSDKIRNFLSTSSYPGVADTWIVQYEYLVLKGTQNLIQRLQEWTGLEPKCDAKPPQLRKPKPSRVISPEFAAHVRQHLNWTVEGWIGYQVEPRRETTSPSE